MASPWWSSASCPRGGLENRLDSVPTEFRTPHANSVILAKAGIQRVACRSVEMGAQVMWRIANHRHPRESGDPARGVSISPGMGAQVMRGASRTAKIGWILFQPVQNPARK